MLTFSKRSWHRRIVELKIHAQDPHKHRTDVEIYTWDDEVVKKDNTEIIYIIPEEINNG